MNRFNQINVLIFQFHLFSESLNNENPFEWKRTEQLFIWEFIKIVNCEIEFVYRQIIWHFLWGCTGRMD